MHSILRQQEAQFVAVGGCGCLLSIYRYSTLYLLYLSNVFYSSPKASRQKAGYPTIAGSVLCLAVH